MVLWQIGCAQPKGVSIKGIEFKRYPDTTYNSIPLNKYYLRVGDVISIRSTTHEELNEDEVLIRPDGKISLKLIDDVKAAGFEPAKLDELLTNLYYSKGDYRKLELTVIVREIAEHKVFVGGEVIESKFVTLKENMTVSQALFEARGANNNANLENVLIIRMQEDNKPVGYVVNLKEVFLEGKYEQDIPLQPYDTIFVPSTSISRIDRAFEQYFRQLLPIRPGFGFAYVVN